MDQASNPAELVGCAPEDRLLGEEMANLPQALGRPEPIPRSRMRAPLVGIGGFLTAVTLTAGVALVALGPIDAVANGFSLFDLAALALGAVLVGLHWGWVHVAEAMADGFERRSGGEVLARRRRWLEAIEPYPRYEVTTSVGEDGAISIDRVAHRPILRHEGAFTFVREVEHREVHSGEEPGAEVAERAELLRHQAAIDTERERERFEIAADAYAAALLGHDDEQQRAAARRAASEALSEQINANLRHPPLVE
ncbi:MAG: hypothetical protein ACR2LV_00060 [Solirubrobacteraceae bacterium]